MKTKKRVLAYLLTLTLAMTSLPIQLFAQITNDLPLPISTLVDTQTTTPGAIQINPTKYVGDGYEVEFKVTEQKKETFTGKFTLTNTGTCDIEDWTLRFDFDHKILDIQNANILDQDGTQCILQASSDTNIISQGQSIEIIFEATYVDSIQEPTLYILDEEINYQNYPQDEEGYKIWKENVLKKEERKRNNSKLYEITTLATTEPTSGSISNEYIKFNYLDGRHGVVTTGGNPDNPNDDNKLLIYGGGTTSYTTIRIDGNNYEFRPDTVTRYDNKIIGTKRINDIIVSQHIGIIPNQYTGRDDVVEFFYTVENTSNTPHDVGVRIMFDTMLGNNDAAPFRLPAIGDVTTETDLSGEEIPEFWQAFDNLTNPKVIAQGTLKVDKESTPDRVRFTNWRSAASYAWDYTRETGSPNGDSAVCLYWNEQKLEKDDTLACKTFYGLSALQQDLRPPLALALTGATKLEVVKNKDGKEEYSPNPFTVTAYIENIGTGAATNTNITLNLPKGMEVVNGKKTISLGKIPVGTKQYQVSWKVNVEPSSADKVEEYSVTLVADNAEAKTLKRAITIPKLQASQLKLLLDRSSIKDGNQLNVNLKIVNEGDKPVNLSDLYARYYYLDEKPGTKKDLNCDDAKIADPYSRITEYIIMNSVQNISPQANGANAYIEFSFDKNAPKLLPGQAVIISTRMNNSGNWSPMIMSNDYSYVGEGANTQLGFQEWQYMTMYEGENKNHIWGKEPTKASVMNFTGIYYNDGIIDEWEDGNVVLNNVEVSYNAEQFNLKGTLIDLKDNTKEDIVLSSVNNFKVEQDLVFGLRNYIEFKDTSQYEVISCTIEENAMYEWLKKDNKNLVGKDVFRLVLRRKNSNKILDIEGEWCSDGIELGEIKYDTDEESGLIAESYNKWFVNYVRGLDSQSPFMYVQEEECYNNNTFSIETRGTTENYMNIDGKKVLLLGENFLGLPMNVDGRIFTSSQTSPNEIKARKFKPLLGSTMEENGYAYISTIYPAGSGNKLVELISYTVYSNFGNSKISSHPLYIKLKTDANYTYLYRPAIADPEVANDIEYGNENVLVKSKNYNRDYSSRFYISDITIGQSIAGNNNDNYQHMLYFNKTIGCVSKAASNKGSTKGLTMAVDCVLKRIKTSNIGKYYLLLKDMGQVGNQLTKDFESYFNEGEDSTDVNINAIIQGGAGDDAFKYSYKEWDEVVKENMTQGYYIDKEKGIYVPVLPDTLNYAYTGKLSKTNDEFAVVYEVGQVNLENYPKVQVDWVLENKEPSDKWTTIYEKLKTGYNDDNTVKANAYKYSYEVQFTVYHPALKKQQEIRFVQSCTSRKG